MGRAQPLGCKGDDTLPLKRDPLFTVGERTEVSAKQLLAHSSAQPAPILQRTKILEAPMLIRPMKAIT
jgi:hypothetical protein